MDESLIFPSNMYNFGSLIYIDNICFSCSIGSLGAYATEDGVKNVTVTDSIFTGTQNGVRIKTWARPSNGFARNIRFRNIIMTKVFNPIIIDQNYCPDNHCPHQVKTDYVNLWCSKKNS